MSTDQTSGPGTNTVPAADPVEDFSEVRNYIANWLLGIYATILKKVAHY